MHPPETARRHRRRVIRLVADALNPAGFSPERFFGCDTHRMVIGFVTDLAS